MDTKDGDSPFPVNALPPILRDAVQAVVERFRIPSAQAAIAALACVSAAIGKGLWVEHPIHKATPGNLYILGVSPSGGFKTTTLNLFVAPIKACEHRLRIDFATNQRPALLATLIGINRALKKAESIRGTSDLDAEQVAQLLRQKSEVEDQLVEPTLIFENATTEALAIGLAKNGECAASISDDARGLLDIILGRYQKSGNTDEAAYLKFYSVTFHKVDRATRAPLVIAEGCLTICWMVQPDKFLQLQSSKSMTESGYLPRFLVAYIDTNSEPWPIHLNTEFPDLSEYNFLIQELLDKFRLRKDRSIVSATAEAFEVLRAMNLVTTLMRKQYPPQFYPFVDRWDENFWRLALVLHAATHGAKSGETELTANTAKDAYEIFNWFRVQQLQMFLEHRQRAQEKELQDLRELVKKRGPISTRQISQYHRFGRTEEVRNKMRVLADKREVFEEAADLWIVMPSEFKRAPTVPTTATTPTPPPPPPPIG